MAHHKFHLKRHARIQEFSSGGGGSRSICFSPQLILPEVKWSISKKSIIFQGPRGGPTFSRGGGGGVQLFPGGGGVSNCLFPIETHITCHFPGGSGPPVPPSGPALERGNKLDMF